MLLKLLSAAADSSGAGNEGNGWGTLVMMGILLLVIIGFSIYNNRAQKKRQAETQKQLDAIQPGTKIKTIGGICGVVVEVGDDNTFVLETGSKDKKSYIKFDKQAVYQSDAVVEDDKKKEKAAKKEETVAAKEEETTEETNDKE